MSAELLRRAAALMRERAEAATPGPWSIGTCRHLDSDYSHEVLVSWSEGQFADAGEAMDPHATAEHIASWHPDVALAVADWLDLMAEDYAPYWSEPYAAPFVPVIEKAYRIARAYLGEES